MEPSKGVRLLQSARLHMNGILIILVSVSAFVFHTFMIHTNPSNEYSAFHILAIVIFWYLSHMTNDMSHRNIINTIITSLTNVAVTAMVLAKLRAAVLTNCWEHENIAASRSGCPPQLCPRLFGTRKQCCKAQSPFHVTTWLARLVR